MPPRVGPRYPPPTGRFRKKVPAQARQARPRPYMPNVHRHDHREPATQMLTVHSAPTDRTQRTLRTWLSRYPISRNPVPALQVSLTFPISAICARKLPCRAGPRNENPVHHWCSSRPFAFLRGSKGFVSGDFQARSIPDGPADMPLLWNHERLSQMSTGPTPPTPTARPSPPPTVHTADRRPLWPPDRGIDG